MFQSLLISVFSLFLFMGCGLMNDSKSNTIQNSKEAIEAPNVEANPTAQGAGTSDNSTIFDQERRIDDIEILAQQITFIPQLLDEIQRNPNIFIKENGILKLKEKYDFSNYTLLSGDIQYETGEDIIVNMRLVDNRYSITKEYINYKFIFIDENETSLYPISGQEIINNHTFLAVNDTNQSAMKFDSSDNLLKGGLFRYINQNGSQVIFEAIGINEIKISVDKNFNGTFEDSEKINIIVGEL